jgi:hypothetical protein
MAQERIASETSWNCIFGNVLDVCFSAWGCFGGKTNRCVGIYFLEEILGKGESSQKKRKIWNMNPAYIGRYQPTLPLAPSTKFGGTHGLWVQSAAVDAQPE